MLYTEIQREDMQSLSLKQELLLDVHADQHNAEVLSLQAEIGQLKEDHAGELRSLHARKEVAQLQLQDFLKTTKMHLAKSEKDKSKLTHIYV